MCGAGGCSEAALHDAIAIENIYGYRIGVRELALRHPQLGMAIVSSHTNNGALYAYDPIFEVDEVRFPNGRVRRPAFSAVYRGTWHGWSGPLLPRDNTYSGHLADVIPTLQPHRDDGTVTIEYAPARAQAVTVTLSGIDGRPDLTSGPGNFSGGGWHTCANGPCPTLFRRSEDGNWSSMVVYFGGPDHEGAMGAAYGPTLHAVFGAIRDE